MPEDSFANHSPALLPEPARKWCTKATQLVMSLTMDLMSLTDQWAVFASSQTEAYFGLKDGRRKPTCGALMRYFRRGIVMQN
jgi:hypothetical protein